MFKGIRLFESGTILFRSLLKGISPLQLSLGGAAVVILMVGVRLVQKCACKMLEDPFLYFFLIVSCQLPWMCAWDKILEYRICRYYIDIRTSTCTYIIYTCRSINNDTDDNNNASTPKALRMCWNAGCKL